MEKLKPCPFCGGEAKVKAYSNGYNIWYRVRCVDCGVEQDGIRNGYYGEEEAIEAWNRRTETHEERTETHEKRTEMNIYDKETRHENCTVQILENTKTGRISVGWWRNE